MKKTSLFNNSYLKNGSVSTQATISDELPTNNHLSIKTINKELANLIYDYYIAKNTANAQAIQNYLDIISSDLAKNDLNNFDFSQVNLNQKPATNKKIGKILLEVIWQNNETNSITSNFNQDFLEAVKITNDKIKEHNIFNLEPEKDLPLFEPTFAKYLQKLTETKIEHLKSKNKTHTENSSLSTQATISSELPANNNQEQKQKEEKLKESEAINNIFGIITDHNLRKKKYFFHFNWGKAATLENILLQEKENNNFITLFSKKDAIKTLIEKIDSQKRAEKNQTEIDKEITLLGLLAEKFNSADNFKKASDNYFKEKRNKSKEEEISKNNSCCSSNIGYPKLIKFLLKPHNNINGNKR